MYSRTPKYARSLNWSSEEKRELVNLVERYKSFIENKDCDSLSHRRRSEAWAMVAKHFSQTFPPGREPQKMKEQYQRMKSSARKVLAQYANRIIQDGYKEGDGARESLKKLPKWINRVISISPRDFVEYCKVVKQSDFSEDDSDDNFNGGQESDELSFDGDLENHVQLQQISHASSTIIGIGNQNPNNNVDCEEPSIKIECDDQHHHERLRENRLFPNNNQEMDETESEAASVSSFSTANIFMPKETPQDMALSQTQRLNHPIPSKKRKASGPPDHSNWEPGSCSERIQWEEHLQRMRHLDEEHAMKMEMMHLHKQVLQQHVQHSIQDPITAHSHLASSAQIFDSLSKINIYSRNFTPLS